MKLKQNSDDLIYLLNGLIAHWEDEVVEFKEAKSSFNRENLGEYFSAISNEANLRNFQYGWLIFGVSNSTKEIVGSAYGSAESLVKLRNTTADCTNNRITFLDIYTIHVPVGEENRRVVLFKIPAALAGVPTSWRGQYYCREGESMAPLSLDKIETIRRKDGHDWSKRLIQDSSIKYLSTAAISVAREKYKTKMAKEHIDVEVDSMTDEEFLTKLRLLDEGRVTHAAMVLLGDERYETKLPLYPEIQWRLYSESGETEDYRIFHIPFITIVDSVFEMVRNRTYRYMPNQLSLFHTETQQYDSSLVKELLHNCIAHADYSTGGRIYENEFHDRLTFTNPGIFLPKDIRKVLDPAYNPPFYRNQLLADTMVAFGMIDTATLGIRKIFRIQQAKYFPLPDYDTSRENEVRVTVYGRILDKNYTYLLHDRPELDLDTVFLIDKVQKGERLTTEEVATLRKLKLVEGRAPNLFLSATISDTIDEKAQYIRNIVHNDDYLKTMMVEHLKTYGSGKKSDFMNLILPELPRTLNEKQRENKVKNLLKTLKNEGIIDTNASRGKNAEWVLR